jgi:hypothetical protein
METIYLGAFVVGVILFYFVAKAPNVDRPINRKIAGPEILSLLDAWEIIFRTLDDAEGIDGTMETWGVTTETFEMRCEEEIFEGKTHQQIFWIHNSNTNQEYSLYYIDDALIQYHSPEKIWTPEKMDSNQCFQAGQISSTAYRVGKCISKIATVKT